LNLTPILLVDDHPIVAEAFALLCSSAFPEYDVHLARTKAEAMRVLRSSVFFEIIFLDLGLPDCVDLEALQAIRIASPQSRIVIFSGDTHPETIAYCIANDVTGYILKTSDHKSIINALKEVFAGRQTFPSEISRPHLVKVHPRTQANAYPAQNDAANADILTHRQREVMNLMLEGLSNKEIAKNLKLSDGTVKLHAAAVLKAMGAKTRTQLVVSFLPSRLRSMK
jgi:DNA-binding NarL/FixJ family response regulator